MWSGLELGQIVAERMSDWPYKRLSNRPSRRLPNGGGPDACRNGPSCRLNHRAGLSCSGLPPESTGDINHALIDN